MDEYIYKDEAFAIIENKQREICPMGRYSRAAVYGSDRESFDNWQEILDEIVSSLLDKNIFPFVTADGFENRYPTKS